MYSKYTWFDDLITRWCSITDEGSRTRTIDEQYGGPSFQECQSSTANTSSGCSLTDTSVEARDAAVCEDEEEDEEEEQQQQQVVGVSDIGDRLKADTNPEKSIDSEKLDSNLNGL